MDFPKRTWAEISLDAIKHNFNQIKSKLCGNTRLCCVIKADGYGHGAVKLAKTYQKLGADFFAVSNIDEALELRRFGISLPTVILGYTPPDFAKQLCENNISQAVYSLEYAKLISAECQRQGCCCKIHIKIDTGMSRIGFMCQQFPRDDYSVKEICEAASLPNLETEGLFTHFCVSDEAYEGKDFTEKQYSNFSYVKSKLAENGIAVKIAHCANSGAIEDYPSTYEDMTRAGIILYGLAPSSKLADRLSLIPAMTLKTVIAHIKELKKGSDVSYGRTFTAQKDMRVATLPIGYADGFIRENAQNGYVLIHGKKAKILGRICMDQTMVDVTDIPDISIGDEAIVFGSGENGEMTADTVAENTDTINYEVICLVSKRVPRVFYENGKITDVMYKL